VILIQATDFLAYPMVPCGSCAQAQNVTNLTNAEVLAAITPLVRLGFYFVPQVCFPPSHLPLRFEKFNRFQ